MQKEFRRTAAISGHRVTAPLLLPRAGIGQNWEFRLETDSYVLQSSREAGGCLVREEGGAPVAVGAKYQINRPSNRKTPTLGVIAEVVPPSGSRTFRSRRTSGDLRPAAD